MNSLSQTPASVQKLLCLLVVLFCGPGFAQDAKVRTSLATNDVVWVGQKVTIVVELLAPGYFASAAAFDLPDPQGVLLVPPLEHPIVSSETIDETSYTVQRHELSAFATRAGAQSVPALKVRFSFKRTPLDTNEVPATVTTTPLSFTVQSPPGAENLGTVISAKGLKVEEAWQPEPGQTNVLTGTAFTRTVTFSAPEVPGMVFPPFPAGQIEGLGIYTKRQINDQAERGALQGGRRDVITYVCQRPGQFTIPAARLIWFDVEAKQLQTNDFSARTFTVIPNPALASTAATATATSTSGAAITQRPTPWWQPAGLMVLVSFALMLGLSVRFRRMLARFLALFRPVHLQPLNPTSTSDHPN